MTSAYRDDPATIKRFEQYVGTALDLLTVYDAIPQRMTASPEHLATLQQDARIAWEGVWEQLESARAIAAALGRPVRTFDRARAAAGDIWAKACEVQRRMDGYGRLRRQTITWCNRPLQPAMDAIEALASAVPEATITCAEVGDVDLTPNPRLARFALLVPLIALIGIALAAFIAVGWMAGLAVIVMFVFAGLSSWSRGP